MDIPKIKQHRLLFMSPDVLIPTSEFVLIITEKFFAALITLDLKL